MNLTGGFIQVAASASPAEGAYRPAVLIPVYDHEEAIGPTLSQVLQHDCPVMLVDDGSGETCRQRLLQLREQHSQRVSLLRLEVNGGKGAAVKAGLMALMEQGYSHAIQLDADGQHEISDLPRFLAASKASPTHLVSGYPQYDNVPWIRYYARYLTHVWIWINTLSFEIRDTMCGFRVYPLAAVTEMLAREPCGDRMEFDPEVMVRWSWRGGRVVNLPIRVNYPIDGVSHFNLWKDNLLISWMHTRLFFGMLYRLPVILWRKLNG
ncbi:MAG: glycosyltransferase family 2 protein [Gammaproteobacteria bacterium]|nr:glycosyltransferase family 2 protein [Gammaproteobacteria bacterium]